jgi:hypothetical protein
MKYDLEFEVDPLFKNMTARFNETGARGLLLNNLPVDEHLDILLESKKEEDKQNNKNEKEIKDPVTFEYSKLNKQTIKMIESKYIYKH